MLPRLATALGAAATLVLGSQAIAQSFTFDVVWQPVENIGGMTGPDGPQYAGGTVNGSYTATYADGTKTTGKVRCVGMDQPDGGIFAIHMACTSTEAAGSASVVWGCNFLGKPGPETPLGCVGGIEGKEGQYAKRRGAMTMEWYSNANSRGTGQWYGGQ